MGAAGIDGGTVYCSYTRARRFPLVVGKIGGLPLPWPLTIAQLVVLVGSLVLLIATRPLWSVVSPFPDLLTIIAVPAGLTWAARHLRLEGRSPFKAAVGLMYLLAAPRRGRVRGRRHWFDPRSHRVTQTVYISSTSTRATVPTTETVLASVASTSPPASVDCPVGGTPGAPPGPRWPCLHEEAA